MALLLVVPWIVLHQVVLYLQARVVPSHGLGRLWKFMEKRKGLLCLCRSKMSRSCWSSKITGLDGKKTERSCRLVVTMEWTKSNSLVLKHVIKSEITNDLLHEKCFYLCAFLGVRNQFLKDSFLTLFLTCDLSVVNGTCLCHSKYSIFSLHAISFPEYACLLVSTKETRRGRVTVASLKRARTLGTGCSPHKKGSLRMRWIETTLLRKGPGDARYKWEDTCK